eukprot:scaffold246483_cov24-Tisochrysis_lutea.AAC.1
MGVQKQQLQQPLQQQQQQQDGQWRQRLATLAGRRGPHVLQVSGLVQDVEYATVESGSVQDGEYATIESGLVQGGMCALSESGSVQEEENATHEWLEWTVVEVLGYAGRQKGYPCAQSKVALYRMESVLQVSGLVQDRCYGLREGKCYIAVPAWTEMLWP